MSDRWQADPERYQRCLTCHGVGRKRCGCCGGRGGRFALSFAYGSSRRGVARETWQPCYRCYGRGTALCWRCGGTGSVMRAS